MNHKVIDATNNLDVRFSQGILSAANEIRTRIAVVAIMLAAAGLAAGCGGSTGNGPPPPPIAPPSNLTYSHATITAIAGQPITADTPTVTGSVNSYAVSPALPAGLALSSSTGKISGTPTVVAAQATYTVTASNSAGNTSATIQIGVSAPPPAPPSNLTYPETTIAATVGQPVTPDIPTVTGTVTSYTVMPALPEGLTLDGLAGTISGTPTAVAASATYTVTASNSGGSATASIVISVNSASSVLLDLGHAGSIVLLRAEASRVLSQDGNGHWVLWNYASGTELANGDQSWPGLGTPLTYQWSVDMAGSTVAIGITNGIEVRSSADGHLLALIISPLIDSIAQAPTATWWKLASDGSYICAGSKAGLSIWGTAGQLLVSKQGNYSGARVFAAPGQVQVAMGAAGQNVIETISTADGTSTVGPAFQGVFHSWFQDGSRFLTNQGTTVWTYSNASSQQAIVSLPTIEGLTGQENWIWTYNASSPNASVDIYSIGASSPSASFNMTGSSLAIPSGPTIGVLSYGSGASSVIDLSGPTPSKVDFTYPVAYTTAYASTSASQWLVGNRYGVIVDGASLSSTTRYFGYGTAWSIAGGTGAVAVATASGKILYFDPSMNTPEGSINFSSSKLAMSSDGTVLAAAANANDAQYETDRTLNVYSIPSNSVINSWPYQFSGSPTLFDFSMSGSGGTIGQILGTLGSSPPSYGRQVTAVSGGPILWSDVTSSSLDPIQLSPDGTLIAVSNFPRSWNSATNIYKNGILVTAVPGWVVGWIDNDRMLVNNYVNDPELGSSVYASATIYDATGTSVATPNLPELQSIQTVTSDSVYYPQLNTIFSLTSGASTWTSPNKATGVGAVAGAYVVYASGNRVLADTY